MRYIVLLLAVGALFWGLFATTSPALAGVYEDPQLCVNGKLLRVDPTTAPIEVWVQVGPELTVDYTVVNCGGDPDLAVIDPSHVSVGGSGNQMAVKVQTEPRARVSISFGERSKIFKADKHGWIVVRGRVH